MAIKAGQIIHDAEGFVIDRIQTGGVSNLNIPQEKIYELGNYQTVAIVRDIPDLSFEMESFDVSTEVEALLTGVDPTTVSSGQEFDLNDSIPLDVISPFKDQNLSYTVVKGLSVPYLTLEQAVYRFGVKQNSTQQFTLRGDSLYYIPGTPKQQSFTITAGTNQTYNLAQTAILYQEAGDNIHVLAACAKNPSTGTYKRLFFGTDYTDTTTTITTLASLSALGYTKLHVTYGTATAGSYPQTVHQGVSVKPAAVKGKDIDVYIGTTAATPTFSRWTGVQNFEVTRRVNLDNDEEFGNHHYVSSDYDVPDVNGSITVKPADSADLFSKVQQVTNVNSAEVVGPFTSVTLPVELRVSDPDTGSLLKTIYIPDARFTPPAVQGRVQQKLTVQFQFQSDGGQMFVYKGARP